MSRSTRTTRALTVAATIVALLLSMAAFTLPVDEGLEVTDGVADAAALVPVGEVGDTVGGAVGVVTEAVPLSEPVPEVVGAEPVLPSPGSPAPEPPPAPEPAPAPGPAPAPAPTSDSAPDATSAPAAPAPTPRPAARPEAPAATPGPSTAPAAPPSSPATSPAPGDASSDGESDGASAPAEPAESARDVAAAGDAVAPQPVAQLSTVETAALKSSSVAGSEPGSGAGSHPVLQPLVAPPFEQDGPASALAPLVAPPATTGLSDLLTSGPRLDGAPVRLSSADAPVWLLATAFGLLVLTVAGHAGRFARQRAGTRS